MAGQTVYKPAKEITLKADVMMYDNPALLDFRAPVTLLKGTVVMVELAHREAGFAKVSFSPENGPVVRGYVHFNKVDWAAVN